MSRQEITDIMRYGTRREKIVYLSDFDVLFDTYNRNVENADEIVNTFIDCALASEDEEMTNEMLEVICSAQMSQDLKNVDYGKIAKNLDTVPERFLPRYIDILSYSGDAQYVPVILQYNGHENPDVREAVRDALIELRATDHEK